MTISAFHSRSVVIYDVSGETFSSILLFSFASFRAISILFSMTRLGTRYLIPERYCQIEISFSVCWRSLSCCLVHDLKKPTRKSGTGSIAGLEFGSARPLAGTFFLGKETISFLVFWASHPPTPPSHSFSACGQVYPSVCFESARDEPLPFIPPLPCFASFLILQRVA